MTKIFPIFDKNFRALPGPALGLRGTSVPTTATATMNYHYQLDIKVRDYELDAEGIVNNANYLHYLEMTRHAFCEELGFSFGDMLHGGLVPVLRHADLTYLHPLRSHDVMTSCLRVEVQGVRFIFHQDIFNKATGEPVLKGVVTVVCLDGGRVSRALPLVAALKPYLEP